MKLLHRHTVAEPVVPEEPARAHDEVDDLIDRLSHEEALSRHAAAAALGRTHDPRALEPLVGMVEFRVYKDADGRLAAARALAELGDRRAVAPLAAVLGRLVGIVDSCLGMIEATPEDRLLPDTAQGAAVAAQDALVLAEAIARLGGPEAQDALRSLADDVELRAGARPADRHPDEDPSYRRLRERADSLLALAEGAVGRPHEPAAGATPGRFKVVVVDTYYGAQMAARLGGALGGGAALAVIAAKEADGSFSFQGTAADGAIADLRRVQGDAVLFVPADTLPLLERDEALWQRVAEVERR